MPSTFGRQLAALGLLIFLSRGFPARQADSIGHVDFQTDSLGPIDAVYTWVNGSDPTWKSKRDYWHQLWIQEQDGLSPNITNRQSADRNDQGDGAADENHFRDNDELRYSVRSVEQYAPWIRRIYIVTNGQVPSWLDADSPRIQIVRHSDIFQNTSHLPVFSSSAIESNLDRIPGLSDYFLYFNDDVFLGAPVSLDDFITPAGVQNIHLSHPVPLGDDAYPEYWSKDRLTPKSPDEFEDYGFVDDGQGGVKTEQLLGKAVISSLCEQDTEIPQSFLDEIWASNRTAPDNSKQIKTVALLDAISQCPKDHDLVADAIRSVIKAFNGRFQQSKHLRRVPSHMPHMINKHVLTELKWMFPEEFQLNSAHRFRHPHDLQVGFAYFNYLVNRPYFLSSKLSAMRDQHLALGREGNLRALADVLCTQSDPIGFYESIQKCLQHRLAPTNSETTVAMFAQDVEYCINTVTLPPDVQRKGYRLKMGTDVTFHMLGDDNETTLSQLQSTRNRPTKFICLNDDMKSPSLDVRRAFIQLLQDLWPVPSSFEKDVGALLSKTQTSAYQVSVIMLCLYGFIVLLCLLRPAQEDLILARVYN
ncbi:hypothetical protein ASPWEDRAFT_404636 [Aspergillus wentii DTO 134E9]|uniref:Stealth protein CR2 conserved region 2 domain-containing protein n=1 Tax=Aspergillus wentii DTO 134E9 TaxID=1073089 RepID=A0A1L9RNC2_ASPWE|nr:uncharacterized protein ASPWEDRAFT_404636 [Aspergillus wentii DTO 134E9]OJJ36337.1 hypothetical protein ASPWEDRAFT_404636 [Aspergillus wentii DTO 134E9]